MHCATTGGGATPESWLLPVSFSACLPRRRRLQPELTVVEAGELVLVSMLQASSAFLKFHGQSFYVGVT